MKRVFVLIMVVTAFLLSSCSGSGVERELADIDTYIQEKPDSALKVLEGIDAKALKSRKSRAQYSLLYTIALNKNYIDTTDLDILKPAMDYYPKYGSSIDKMRTYYYLAGLYFNRKEDDRSMCYLMKALEDSSSVKDYHYKELVNSLISDVFARNNNSEQELHYALAAQEYGKLAKDSVGVWAIGGHIATCYGNLLLFEESERYYQNFFSQPIYDTIAFTGRQLLYANILVQKEIPEPERSIEIIENIAFSRPECMTLNAYCVYAFAQQLVGNDDVASSMIVQLEEAYGEQDVIDYYKYLILKEQELYELALEELENTVIAQDSAVVETLRQSLLITQKEYFEAENELLNNENRIEKMKRYLLLAISCGILLLVVLLFIKRKALLGKRIEELSSLYQKSQEVLNLQIEQSKEVNEKLSETNAILLSLQKQFMSMFRARFKLMNDLCSAYLSPLKKSKKDIVYDEVEKQLSCLADDKESMGIFISMINSSLNNIIDKMKADLPSHKDQDFRFLALVVVGFDATTISSITGYSIGTVYTKKNRLKNEISKLDSPNKEFFLTFFAE